MTVYAAPGAAGAKIAYKPRYDNFIGGKFVAPVKGQYFDVISPVNGQVYTLMQGPSELGAAGRLVNWDRSNDLGRIKVPTLVVGARHDTMARHNQRDMIRATGIRYRPYCIGLTNLTRDFCVGTGFAIRDFSQGFPYAMLKCCRLNIQRQIDAGFVTIKIVQNGVYGFAESVCRRRDFGGGIFLM